MIKDGCEIVKRRVEDGHLHGGDGVRGVNGDGGITTVKKLIEKSKSGSLQPLVWPDNVN